MTAPSNAHFKSQYERHLKHLQFKGLPPEDDRAPMPVRFGASAPISTIGWITSREGQLLIDYFADLLQTHSWASAKLDLYGLKFFYTHVLKKPWVELDLVKAPKAQRLPDIVTVDQVRQLLAATRVRSYHVLFFTLYSLGLRLGEGLRLQVGDIDADRQRVHVRNAKGNKDRLVPLPDATLVQLRAFWRLHRHPKFLFPNRHGGLAAAATAKSPLDRGGVQQTLKRVVADCRIKKRSPRTACATATPPICWKPASIC